MAICIIFLFSLDTDGLFATPIYNYSWIHQPVIAKNALVATQNQIATRVGIEILKQGGNAVDASVAVGFALAVTLPRAGNIGGGGFMMIYLKKSNKVLALDYRETAPLKATSKMFLDKQGEVSPLYSQQSYKAVGVPGTVAGLTYALKKYGTKSLKVVLQPAIRLARQGFLVDYDLYNSLKYNAKRMKQYSASKNTFFHKDGTLYQPGERFKQPRLADSLELIATQGSYAFYRGKIARLFVKDMASHGGLITLKDLKSYKPVLRKPVRGSYRDHIIYSMPPPSSGGIALIQILNILENFKLHKIHHNSANFIRLLVEATKVAYADRAKFLGDPDFVSIPTSKLISKKYAKNIANQIQQHSPYINSHKAHFKINQESRETTHYSIIDRSGNAVSNTYTLNFSYGMGAVVKGTGILLNNEMDDFSASVGSSNAYGLIGSEANSIQPKKRMLSSMSPSFVFKKDKLFMVTGSPGGSRIITTVLQQVINVIDYNMNIAEATAANRIHHQWRPEHIYHEKGISHDTLKILHDMGYSTKVVDAFGALQSILILNKILHGYSDPRKPNAATLGY